MQRRGVPAYLVLYISAAIIAASSLYTLVTHVNEGRFAFNFGTAVIVMLIGKYSQGRHNRSKS